MNKIPQHWQDWYAAALRAGAGQAQLIKIVEDHGRTVTFNGVNRRCVQTPAGRWALPATAAGRWFLPCALADLDAKAAE